jgi:hypothetical protein
MPGDHNLDALENQFHRAMIGVYEAALQKCHYNATRFLQMVNVHGGIEAAKILLHTPGFQYGFTELWLCKCLGLSMEALVIRDEYAPLFTAEERQIALERLKSCDYPVDNIELI